MTTQAAERVIGTLQPYLRRTAQNIVSTYYPHLPVDDVLQEMNVALIVRAADEPAFLDQTPGYQVRYAAWQARSWCRSQRDTHRQISLDALCETRPDPPAYTPDQDLILDIRAALATLSDRDRTIADRLTAGYNQVEIASQLGCAQSAVSYALRRIRAALAPCAGIV